MAAGPVTDETRVRSAKYAFEWAFGLGFVTILVAKLVVRGEPIVGGLVASGIGIVIMILYVAHQKRARPESEQPRLGDEVYYLGLLYTLTSLCGALVSLFLLDGVEQMLPVSLFPPDGGEQTLEKRTNEMIGSFGIALLTTMAGIVMRMPLQRRAADGPVPATIIRIPHSLAGGSGGRSMEGGGRSAEIEGTTVAIDLERYALELRRQLQTATNAFASHTNQTILQARTTHAHMDEMMKAFHDGLEEKAKARLESLEAIYKAIAANAEEVMDRTETQQAGIRSALEQLETHLMLVTDQFKGVLGASKRQEEALDVTVKKLQALAEAVSRELEGQRNLKGAIAEIADVAVAAGRYGESLKDTEREVQRINTGLKGVRSAMQDEGHKLAVVLRQAIVAFDEARQGGEGTKSWIGRVFRR